jgi:hypothetical protein
MVTEAPNSADTRCGFGGTECPVGLGYLGALIGSFSSSSRRGKNDCMRGISYAAGHGISFETSEYGASFLLHFPSNELGDPVFDLSKE